MLRQMSSILGSLFLVAAVLSPEALAQSSSPAKCTNQTFAGYSNSRGVDPCTVGIEVGQICDPGFTIPSGDPGQTYTGVRAGADTQCICSNVYYNLLVVCGACEGAETVLWGVYSSNCTSTFEGMPPTVPIPAGLAIPHWAFTPVLSNGSVNVPAIIADNSPDVTGTASATTQSASQTGPSSPVTPTSFLPSPSQSPDNSSGGGGGTNAGAIAGGVVGGIAGLIILAGLAFFLHRYLNKKKVADGAESGNARPLTSVSPPGWVSPEQGSTLRSMSHYRGDSYGSDTAPKLYNPDDPSTFPPPVHSTIVRAVSPGQPTINSSFSAFPHTTTPSEYGEWSPYNRPTSTAPEI
ncbi:hypothetical protein K435DRAFT_844507 [Dendrothele bispora CBS 962.96]|uniref:Mid2 domain-containing protein n=1 Tax=Dendrothele bispora (strain CBS 962.96) TaxID=1314807 RepID=A0A4S8L249_DENBC|nr:hypothetical protein K435DRAFT_844507 [Dendrothele bispora CBS 962.96]